MGLVGAATLAQAAQPQAVTVYSSRIEALLKPTLDEYTKQTGVKINLLTDRGGSLAERLAAEGKSSPADVLITVDMGNLHNAAERGLLQHPRQRRPARGMGVGLDRRGCHRARFR